MSTYLFRRALQGLIALILLTVVVFIFVNVLLPGDFVSQFAMGMEGEQREALRHELGLDLPLWQQYLTWMSHLLRGDPGNSLYGPTVTQMLLSPFLTTAFTYLSGMLLAFGIGQWLGKTAAWKRGIWSDGAILLSVFCYGLFPPTLAFIRHYLRIKLNNLMLVPPSIHIPSNLSTRTYASFADLLPDVVPLLVIVAVITGTVLIHLLLRWAFNWRLPGWLAGLILVIGITGGWYLGSPQTLLSRIQFILVFALITFGEVAILMHTSMGDTLQEDYIQMAKAKGLKSRAIRNRHAGRNAILPVLSKMVVSLPYLMTGLVLIETAFGYIGLGPRLFAAIAVQDYPVILGALVAIGLMSLASRLILDVLIAMLDPRVTFRMQEISASGARGRLRVHIPAPREWFASLRSSIGPPSQWPGELRQAARNLWRANIPRISRGWAGFRQSRPGMVGLALIVLFGLLALAHPILLETMWPAGIYDPEMGFDMAAAPHPSQPSAAHLLGTDALGRDIFSQLLASTREAFTLALCAALTTGLFCLIIGAVSAYYRGVVDALFSNLADALLLLPIPILMVILGARFYNELDTVRFGLLFGTLVGCGSAAVVMRSQALTLMTKPYIESARVAGANGWQVITNHLIPNMLPLAAVQMMFAVTGAIIADGFIAFYGMRNMRLNWGVMVYNSMAFLNLNPTIPWAAIIAPSAALSIFAAAFYLLSRGFGEQQSVR